ncbi:uncharacterized protein LOC144654274 isoform X2 [Oculina patagonica]
MALQPFTNEQLNYFKFAFVVLNEFPKALRQTLKHMWNNTFAHLPGYQPWDDSITVRNMFLATEGGKTKVPTYLSYDEWDCTALFQATIYARSFALPDSSGHHRTLSDLYVKPWGLPHGTFYSSVISPGGNNAETFALAIDQLRLLRNAFCHSSSSEIDKKTFDQYIQHTKDAIKALGVTTDPIDAVGSLTESDFPTQRVSQLEDGIKKELQAESTFLKENVKDELIFVKDEIIDVKDELKGVRSDIKTTAANQETMNEKIDDINQKIEELKTSEQSGSKTFLPRSNLPPKVPHFTGRETECDEIVGHMTSESTRLVSVWGSPGFGKTSIAIAVGHHLEALNLPVYFLSLRGLKSKSDLTSKFLSLFRQPGTFETNKNLPNDDELCLVFDRLLDRCVIILDNADDLFECGEPNVKEEVINLIGDLLIRSDKVNFLLTTRESLSFLKLHLQGHMAVRIRQLDHLSSQALARELLPEASTSDLTKVSQICGQVPLAIKVLCSSISEDFARCSQYLDEFMECSDNIVEMLDDPDYPRNLRLKTLFNSSFQRLSTKEQESLVALCILPAQFDLKIAAAVLGITRTTEAEKVLRRLQRKSLIDCCTNSDKFSMHKLIHSFAKEKGETDMRGTVLISKSRYHAFYIDQFEKLNENFLTGCSMSAFIEFYEHEKDIYQSLIDGCLDSKTADRTFDVLTKGELFLASLYWSEGAKFFEIFNSAIVEAKQLGKNLFYRRLLNSRAFGEVPWGNRGNAKKLLSESKELQVPTSSDCDGEKGKHLCYFGIYQLVVGKTEDGVKVLQNALSYLNTSPEHTILKLIIFQIFAFYYQFKNDTVSSSEFYMKALKECTDAGNTCLLVIPMITTSETQKYGVQSTLPKNANPLLHQPLQIEVIFILSKAVKTFFTTDTKHFFSNLLLRILYHSELKLQTNKLGWFNFYRNAVGLLESFSEADAMTITKERISFHQKALQQSMQDGKENIVGKPEQHEEALAQNCFDLGVIQHNRGNYPEALELKKRALDIRRKVFGEEHPETAVSYHSVGVTQHSLGDYISALESVKRALDIRRKVFGEEHSETADSYHSVGITQHSLGDYTSALESVKRALDIRRKVFGEEHPQTANSYHTVGATQHSLGDYTSALESVKRALDIRRKVFGEEHSETADSYHSVGVTQHSLGDYTSALESVKRALDIRRKVFGEEHSETADSYNSVGVTQHSLGDYTSALVSKKRALNIRRKLFGEEHSETADSYNSVGITQHSLGDYTSALVSKKRALDIRRKLFGEEHSETADSYHEVGITQHSLGDYTSALESAMRALDIRRKVFGEDHSETADSYHEVGVTQHSLGDYTSALVSEKRALDIRRKLLGEEHPKTADSYHSVGVTQHSLGDYTSALESAMRALDIRRKVFGEDHSETADSYHEVGVTQHSLSDYTSALESKKRALDIRRKLSGEEHPKTADSYHSVGVTQHSLGDYTSALESAMRALDIRRKVFGEDHSQTADSYHEVGITQHSLGDYTSALDSDKRALDIRRKVFGEEHPKTADSYHSVGVTQHSLGDYTSALESAMRALDIRRKVFGEDHSQTADSYHEVGITQHSLGDYTSALDSDKRALDIRRKVFGEEHPKTADSYHSVGVTQHSLGDYTSALESAMRALDIRRKVFGEDHSETADSYHEVGVTQHSLGDYTSALESKKRALDIRRKLSGEELSQTADSYHSVGITQQSLGDYTSALDSDKRALDIRRKVFGEEHSQTADSYHEVGITQHSLGDYTSALESAMRALDIRRKVFGEDHSETADSYHEVETL